jgi:RNA polymerase sigma-70 factor (ECF subfamily)
MIRFQRPEERFYEELIDSMYDRLLEYARCKTHNATEVQDIVQNACLIAWEKIDSVMKSPNPQGWLMNAVKNRIQKYFARLEVERNTVEVLTPELVKAPASVTVGNELSFLNTLSEDEIEIIRLREQGYKHHEIAEMLKLKPGTVRQRAARIARKVKRFIEEK